MVSGNVFQMCTLMEPYPVSNIIKMARWSLLFCGILYGKQKKAFYTEYDKGKKKLREAQIELEHAKSQIKSNNDFKDLMLFIGNDILHLGISKNWDPFKK